MEPLANRASSGEFHRVPVLIGKTAIREIFLFHLSELFGKTEWEKFLTRISEFVLVLTGTLELISVYKALRVPK